MRKCVLQSICFVLFSALASAQSNPRPKIGLTLSGGGAKGLAHIGILKAIDSAGLKIDYITGNSMGAIVGSLYAAGYSGNEIEKMARKVDWESLLSNQIPLRALSMEEKDEYNRFAVELPYTNNKVKLPSGVFNGQELDLKFSELFAPFYKIKNFNELKIPFQCVATNLETGELVILDSGNLVTAVRASMAIPSVFSDVTIDGKRLVDGGLVRNFPVKNVIAMGADYVIGSNVSSGLSSREKINNPVDVIMQLAFFKEAVDFAEEVPLTNLYIYMPLSKYGTASFGSSKQIITKGNETGRLFYQKFKNLADSLQAFQLKMPDPHTTIFNDTVLISEIKVNGLKKTSDGFFIHLMDLNLNQQYSAAQLTKAVRRAYGSRYYNSISYSLQNVGGDRVKIVFDVEENPNTFLKAGLYYSKFRGINVNMNITSRDFLIKNSRSQVSLSLGESIQIEATHLQYLGRRKAVAIIPGYNLEKIYVNTYYNFKQDGAYNQVFHKGFLNIQNSSNNRFTIGAGTSIENVHFRPAIRSAIEASGNIKYLKTYIYTKYNSLNKVFYPTAGVKVQGELGQIYNQQPDIELFENGLPVITNLLNFDNYLRLYLDGTAYFPLSGNFNLFTEFQSGINFTTQPNVLNNFSIGGINGNFRNQVRFAGFQEASISSPSVIMLQLGLRFSVANNLYFIGRFTGLLKDFVAVTNSNAKWSLLTGNALTFAYKTPLGPLELSAMYSPQSKSVQSYVTFGIPF